MVAISGGGHYSDLSQLFSVVTHGFHGGVQGSAATLHFKNPKPLPPLREYLGGLKIGQK